MNSERLNKFANMNVLGIDYGTKITGLANFCPKRDPFPTPFGRIVYESDEQLIREISNIINEEFFEVVVLGLPLYTDGNESDMTIKVREFSEKLKKNIDLEVFLQDETLTTYEAQNRMLNSPQYNFKVDQKKIDQVAASIILEDFFNIKI